jgi:hypothetical protein
MRDIVQQIAAAKRAAREAMAGVDPAKVQYVKFMRSDHFNALIAEIERRRQKRLARRRELYRLRKGKK